MNNTLILACVAAFIFQVALGSGVEALIKTYGFTARSLHEVIEGGAPFNVELATSLLTSLFLHGGWIHIIGNLLYLHVFGDNIEDRLGHVLYLVFYVAAGLAGSLAQYYVDPLSTIPMIGASGAIAGVLGAYIVIFPRAKILTLFPVFIFLTFLEVPAFVFLGIWWVQQLLNGWLAISVTAQTAQGAGGVAWFAHLGGFGLGLFLGLIARLVRRVRRPHREPTPVV